MAVPTPATLDDWIARESITFSADASPSLEAALDRLVGMLDKRVELLGLGEALHGDHDLLRLRNKIFQHLVEQHGYSAIAIESSFPRGHLVNRYLVGAGPPSYDGIQERGFSHNFGRQQTTRELVEWMRTYNADPAHSTKLHFYGFDSPTEMVGTDSPRQLLNFALDYLAALDDHSGRQHRDRIEPLLGEDSAWEDPGASFEPAKSIGQSPAANALRVATEDLIAELGMRRPELIAKSDQWRYREALQHASVARQLLNYHAALAQSSSQRISRLLGIRDLMMADNLEYIVEQERGRGKVFAFAHNSHLQRGMAQWQLGDQLLTWWPAGAQVSEQLGPRYAVIGSAVGVSASQGIGQPEPDTLEARFAVVAQSGVLIPTHRGQGLLRQAIDALPTRSGSIANSTYFPLTSKSIRDFDWLVVLNSMA